MKQADLGLDLTTSRHGLVVNVKAGTSERNAECTVDAGILTVVRG